MGRLADRRRARGGRARPASGAVGARPPRAVGQPRGAARRPSRRRRRPAGRRRPSRRRRHAGGRAVRGATPARHGPRPAARRRTTSAGAHRGRAASSSRSASSPATTQAASLPTPTSRTRSRPTPAWPMPAACRCASTPACATTRSAAALERGPRSGAPPRVRTRDGRATVGWQKCFADGSLGSRTAALLEDIEPEADRPLPPEPRRGVWMTEPDGCASAPPGGGGRDRHDDPRDRRRRGPGRARRPRPRRRGDRAADAPHRARPDARIRTIGRGSRRPGSPPASSPSTSDRTRARPASCGATGRSRGLHVEVDRRDRRGACRSAPTPRSSPIDPWPGLALAVRPRDDARWPAGTPTLRARAVAHAGPRASRRTASTRRRLGRETDRGRLTRRPARRRRRHPGRRRSTNRSSRRGAAVHGPSAHGAARRQGRLRESEPAVTTLALVPSSSRQRVGEQPVEDARRRREGVDRVGQHVDRDAAPGSPGRIRGSRPTRRGTRSAAPTSCRVARSTTIVTWPSVGLDA